MSRVIIEAGKIAGVEKGSDLTATAAATVLDLRGYTVIPGIVGMHNHLFYIARPNQDGQRHFDNPVQVPQMTFSAPRLYLAGGVTTMRTTGSVETYADLNLKRDIDTGKLPGPHIDVTGPCLGAARVISSRATLSHPRRGAANCRVLGRARRYVIQGVHEHHSRGVEGGD